MKVLARLKVELGNREYFSDVEYDTILQENGLNYDDEYNKALMQKNLLYSVIDVLEGISNNVELMRRVQTEFSTTGGAYQYIADQLEHLQKRIYLISNSEQSNSMVSMLFKKR